MCGVVAEVRQRRGDCNNGKAPESDCRVKNRFGAESKCLSNSYSKCKSNKIDGCVSQTPAQRRQQLEPAGTSNNQCLDHEAAPAMTTTARFSRQYSSNVLYIVLCLLFCINNVVIVSCGNNESVTVYDDTIGMRGHFTPTWAVHIPEGAVVANQVAAEHGFVNQGQVSNNFYTQNHYRETGLCCFYFKADHGLI